MFTVLTTVWLAAVVSVVCIADENLLRNTGFEVTDGGMPVSWNLFVQPTPGAQGRLDTQVFAEGAHAAFLHNPGSYVKDPCNNWSQNLFAEVAGKTVVAGGRVKTSGTASAAIWVQCWRRDPWGVLRVASTGDAMPVSGDADWTPVAIKVTVPSDADFVVVRCVLRGVGSAWFDDLRLVEAGADADAVAVSEKPPVAPASPGVSARDNAVAAELARETAALSKEIETLRNMNEALRHDLTRMRDEIGALKEQVESREQPGATTTDAVATPHTSVPPLVPHEQTEEAPQP